MNPTHAIFLALGIPKLVHFHRNQRGESRNAAGQILSLTLLAIRRAAVDNVSRSAGWSDVVCTAI